MQSVNIITEKNGEQDYQGIGWPYASRRDEVRSMRRRTIKPYREFKDVKTTDFHLNCQKGHDEVYHFQAYHQVPHIREQHFQLRYNLTQCALPNTLIYSYRTDLYFYDTEKGKLKVIPIQPEFRTASVNSVGRICAIAGMGGQFALLDLLTLRMDQFQINEDDCITNQAQLLSPSSQYKQHLMTTDQLLAINDLRIVTCDNNRLCRMYDLSREINPAKPMYKREHVVSINMCMPNLDYKLFGLCCDSKNVPLLDHHNDVIALNLEGHSDYNFSIAFNPSNEWELATGSQDTTCLVWDIRKPNAPTAQLFSVIDGVYNLQYTRDGKFLIMGEGTDNIHIFETKHYIYSQVIDYFGRLTGTALDIYDTDSLAFGVHIDQYQGIFQFNRVQFTYL